MANIKDSKKLNQQELVKFQDIKVGSLFSFKSYPKDIELKITDTRYRTIKGIIAISTRTDNNLECIIRYANEI